MTLKIFPLIHLKNLLYFVAWDFNLNCLEFHQSSEIRQFFNNRFEKGAIPLINRSTRVPTSSGTLLDNIFTNSVFDIPLKNEIIQTYISDHFAIFAPIKHSKMKKLKIKNLKLKRDFLVIRTRQVLNRISKNKLGRTQYIKLYKHSR